MAEACEHGEIAYNSCRNRHCPKCQASAARRWLDACQAELLPVDYYHVVFTLPAPISAIAFYNKAVIYRLLFEVAAETLLTIAADPKHLGAQIAATLVLHTWGSALTHHPHVHAVVPGGGLSKDGQRWVACRPGFFLSVRVLSRLFRRRFMEELEAAHHAGQLQFFGEYAQLSDASAFAKWLRRANDHRPDVCARPVHSCAALPSGCAMNTRTSRCSNCLPILHSTESVWISFALSCKSAGDGVTSQRGMWRIDAGSRNLQGILVGLLAMVTVSNRAVVLQIPIAV